jgi:hypothetical protein
MKSIWFIGVLFLISPLFTPNIQHNAEGKTYALPMSPTISEEINYISHLICEGFDTSTQGPERAVLEKALTGYIHLRNNGAIEVGKPLTIIDFSISSTRERLWVIDMEKFIVKHQSLVAHGRNSGENIAKNFSNQHSSYMSSLGFYLTGETYQGNHGYSLRLDGLEKGVNDQARSRAIVIHGAEYVNQEFIAATGRLGRSLGCPALPMETHGDIIDLIKDKSPIFIYAEVPSYLAQSPFLKPLA